MYINERRFKALTETLVSRHGFLTEADMGLILSEAEGYESVMTKASTLVSELVQRVKAIMPNSDSISVTRGDVKKWKHFTAVSSTINTLVKMVGRSEVSSVTRTAVADLKTVCDFLTSAEGVKLLKQSYSKENTAGMLLYSAMVSGMLLVTTNILVSKMSLEGTVPVFRVVKSNDTLTNFHILAEDIRSNQMSSMLRGRVDALTETPVAVFSTIVLAFSAAVLGGRWLLQQYYIVKRNLAGSLQLHAYYLELAMPTVENTAARKNQERYVIKMRALADDISADLMESSSRTGRLTRESDNQIKSAVKDNSDIFTLN